MADRQIRESFGDFGAHKVTDLVVHSVTIHGASQPEVHRRVCVAHAVPHPRVEVGVGGNELEMGLAGWPVEVTVGADLTRLAYSAGDVPAVFCLFSSYNGMSVPVNTRQMYEYARRVNAVGLARGYRSFIFAYG